jgi:predicted nucleic acid-binding protein
VIIDASVALKWALTEPDSEVAAGLIGRGDLSAPAILHIELGYTLTKLARRRLIAPADVLDAWRDLRQADILIYDDDALLDPAFELSLALHASFYDCIYLALAIETADQVVSADERFIRAVRAAPEYAGRVLTLAEAAT